MGSALNRVKSRREMAMAYEDHAVEHTLINKSTLKRRKMS